ncbi:hypothetical protein KUW09_04715 [Mameliella alba]|nr:hypothetical protein [Antarctobacter heliothermus]MBY6143330.1 hypothetical protein [Mameliella alba]MBY6163997.1 hypothetical protein [Mameliella alba]MBY6172469.1 hypothetical protein [Mameliella alba]MBY6177483.1 hypothetical protein [Mameliella alba]
MNRPTTPIYVLKRRAKELSRERGIPLHEAQKQIAKQEGFASWSLLVSRPTAASVDTKITSLPVSPADRVEAIEIANFTFEKVFDRIEPDNPTATRALWDAEDYVDNRWLDEGMLPIDRDAALSLIEAFLVHHVVDLAVQADKKSA